MRVNWYPDYWNYIEKTKLFDFWRYRYGKNNVVFSPKTHFFGGVGFYDASYESLKYQNFNNEKRYNKVKEEYNERRKSLIHEMEKSQLIDKKRLLLLIEAEEKAFIYWEAKVLLNPVDDDIKEILDQTVWIIDEKERMFKESLSNLIEYDRKYFSPLSFPDRNLEKEPLNIDESYFWLLRESRAMDEEDVTFFSNLKKQPKSLDRSVFLSVYEPLLLIQRHKSTLKREQSKNLQRTINGDLIEDKRSLFQRPKIEKDELLKENKNNLEENIKNFCQTDINNINVVLEKEQFKLNLDLDKIIGKYPSQGESTKEKDVIIENIDFSKNNFISNIPQNPYVIVQQKIFHSLKNQDGGESSIIDKLKQTVLQKIKEKQLNKNINNIYKIERTKRWWEHILYFLMDENNNIHENHDNTKFFNTKIILTKDSFVNVNGVTYINESVIKPSFEEYHQKDEFDDVTRFNFFPIKVFDRKKVLNKIFDKKNNLMKNLKKITSLENNIALAKDLKNTLKKSLKQLFVYDKKLDQTRTAKLNNLIKDAKNDKKLKNENKARLAMAQKRKLGIK